jgi:hypothetical protein
MSRRGSNRRRRLPIIPYNCRAFTSQFALWSPRTWQYFAHDLAEGEQAFQLIVGAPDESTAKAVARGFLRREVVPYLEAESGVKKIWFHDETPIAYALPRYRAFSLTYTAEVTERTKRKRL